MHEDNKKQGKRCCTAGAQARVSTGRVQTGLLPTREGEAFTLATWLCASDGRSSMERRFQLVRDSDGATVVRGRWELVCIELSSGRARRLPPEFLAVYQPAVVGSKPV